jgi:hypothetical protein
MTEAKLAKQQNPSTQSMISKKLLRLVVVLLNLKQGMDPADIREQLQLEKLTEKTDNLCGESNDGKSELEQSIKMNSLGSIEETSLTSHRTPSTSAYANVNNSINAIRK